MNLIAWLFDFLKIGWILRKVSNFTGSSLFLEEERVSVNQETDVLKPAPQKEEQPSNRLDIFITNSEKLALDQIGLSVPMFKSFLSEIEMFLKGKARTTLNELCEVFKNDICKKRRKIDDIVDLYSQFSRSYEEELLRKFVDMINQSIILSESEKEFITKDVEENISNYITPLTKKEIMYRFLIHMKELNIEFKNNIDLCLSYLKFETEIQEIFLLRGYTMLVDVLSTFFQNNPNASVFLKENNKPLYELEFSQNKFLNILGDLYLKNDWIFPYYFHGNIDHEISDSIFFVMAGFSVMFKAIFENDLKKMPSLKLLSFNFCENNMFELFTIQINHASVFPLSFSSYINKIESLISKNNDLSDIYVTFFLDIDIWLVRMLVQIYIDQEDLEIEKFIVDPNFSKNDFESMKIKAPKLSVFDEEIPFFFENLIKIFKIPPYVCFCLKKPSSDEIEEIMRKTKGYFEPMLKKPIAIMFNPNLHNCISNNLINIFECYFNEAYKKYFKGEKVRSEPSFIWWQD